MRLVTLIIGLLVAPLAWSEQSVNSTGDYQIDLGQVYGAIHGIQYFKDICNESFPALRKQNNAAFSKWRIQYLPFLQEIEKNWTGLAWRESGGDPKTNLEYLAKMDSYFEQYKNGFRTQLVADGTDSFNKLCSYYSKYLTTERANLEYFYPEQVDTIRRGFEKK